MKEMFRRRRLPHWDVPGATYFVTTCLAGSIPAEGLLDIAQYREELERRPRPDHVAESDWAVERWKRTFARCERWLDGRPAVRHLANSRARHENRRRCVPLFCSASGTTCCPMLSCLATFTGFSGRCESGKKRYPKGGRHEESIMHSINRHSSAIECNRILQQAGEFWQAANRMTLPLRAG